MSSAETSSSFPVRTLSSSVGRPQCELFPTQVRSTAVAFCNGSGRVITSFGPLAAGLLVVQLGGLTNATAIMTGFAALSIVAVILGRETRDEQLPR